MNILHIGKYYQPFQGGIENTMRALMLKQRPAATQVSALVHHHKKTQVFSRHVENDIPIYKMPIQGILLFVPIALFAIKYLQQAINIEKPNILHLHMPNIACFWLLFLPSARSIPWVVHWHSDVVGEKPDWRIKLLYPLYKVFEQALLKRAAKIIVTSPNYLRTSSPLAPWLNKCDVVPLAINVNDTRVLNNAALLYKDTDDLPHLRIICIGRLTYYKGHSYLIKAVKLAVEAGIDCRLNIVGEGELENELKQQVVDSHLNHYISFHGKVSQEQLEQLLRDSDALCLASIERTEAFGLVLLEAMQQHKPCIVTDVPGSGMSYVVEHNKTGMVVDRQNPDALFKAIAFMARNPTKAKAMGELGFNRVVQHFSLDAVTTQIHDIYKKVLAGSP